MPGSKSYRGRFAPSPTGPLHLGSLIAALASYLDARHHGGMWLVRMEDLDPPREEPGASQAILSSLQHHGLQWDEPVTWQSERLGAYDETLQRLRASGQLFNCDCTRAMLGPDGACAGRCAPRQDAIKTPASVRVRVPADCRIEFEDRVQGQEDHQLGQQWPDFVLQRKDGLYAYQLAVVVDDEAQAITHIVRGSDLLDSTPRQLFLQQQLGYTTPVYCHLPVITNAQGQKLSKQNHAPALENDQAVDNLRLALAFLHQVQPPANLRTCDSLLAYAAGNWQLARVAKTLAVPLEAIKSGALPP